MNDWEKKATIKIIKNSIEECVDSFDKLPRNSDKDILESNKWIQKMLESDAKIVEINKAIQKDLTIIKINETLQKTSELINIINAIQRDFEIVRTQGKNKKSDAAELFVQLKQLIKEYIKPNFSMCNGQNENLNSEEIRGDSRHNRTDLKESISKIILQDSDPEKTVQNTEESSFKSKKDPTKFEMLTTLTENEREFYEAVLMRGEREGLWKVMPYVAGGAKEFRTAFGIDFMIQSQETGIVLNIEYKKTPSLKLTLSQKLRFQTENDLPKQTSRLIALLQTRGRNEKKDSYRMVLYFSPAFVKILPEMAFKKTADGAFYMSFSGIEECLNQNLDNILFTMARGKLGSAHAHYKSIEHNEAFEWVYEKLKGTMKNPLEEEMRHFEPGAYNRPIVEILSEKGVELIKKFIWQSYRPIFGEDLLEAIEKDIFIAKSIKTIDSVKYIGGLTLAEWIDKRLLYMEQTDENIVRINIEGYPISQWGLKRHNYIPLSKGASHLLDLFKIMLVKTRRTNYTSAELRTTLNIGEKILGSAIAHSGVELERKNLVKFYKRISHPTLINITKLGIKYIKRKYKNPSVE